jgi:hypothetical protein
MLYGLFIVSQSSVRGDRGTRRFAGTLYRTALIQNEAARIAAFPLADYAQDHQRVTQ